MVAKLAVEIRSIFIDSWIIQRRPFDCIGYTAPNYRRYSLERD